MEESLDISGSYRLSGELLVLTLGVLVSRLPAGLFRAPDEAVIEEFRGIEGPEMLAIIAVLFAVSASIAASFSAVLLRAHISS